MEEKQMVRGAGILMAITSLPSSYGIGTIGEAAYHFIDLLVDLKQRYWQILPIGPTSYGDSPYQSFSAFAGNPYLIDLDLLKKEQLLLDEEIRGVYWGNDERDIDYATLYENRVKVLKKAYQRFDMESTDFLQFKEVHTDWLRDYSFFMALKTFSGNREWHRWEAGLRDREEAVMEKYRKRLAQEIDFWNFCQYKFFSQWAELKQYANSRGVQIIGDIPLYVALDSADVWADRKLFELAHDGTPKCVAGTPPDYYAGDGQIWGNPLYDWKHMEQDGFLWWKKRIKLAAELFDVVRIDHFIGVLRYYSIPFGKEDARLGKWRKGPGKKLTDVIDSVLGDCHIIAEDLGTPVPGAKKLLKRMGWLGIKVLMLAFDGDTQNENLPHNYQETNLVVYAGTHDNDTIVGYYRDKTEYELAYLYEYMNITSKDELPDAFIRLSYASIADVVIVQMQDVLKLGNEARMNQPSTVGHNWRWRVGQHSITEERRTWIRTIATVYRR